MKVVVMAGEEVLKKKTEEMLSYYLYSFKSISILIKADSIRFSTSAIYCILAIFSSGLF